MNAGIGSTVRRKEDVRLVTGHGCYSDDFNFPGQVYSAVVRSPHAHALIRSVDTKAARAMPGVLAVLTGADVVADGLKRIPHLAAPGTAPDIVLHNRDGSPVPAAPHHILSIDRARHVGAAVAFVVAETVAQAKDAAETVVVDYEPLPAVIDAKDAVETGAPRLYDDLPNIMIDAEVGDAKAVDEVFRRAAHVTRLDTWVNRVTGVPMEPRAAVGIYDPATQRYTLYAGSGGIVRQKKEIAAILDVPFEFVRVIAKEIGGNFGTKNSFFPEFALVVWASRRVGRPVKWTCDRSEAFITDYMGRDLTVSAELALDAEGRFLALRTKNLSNVGAHSGSYVPLVKGVGLATSGYRIPVAHISARAVLSTTMCTTPYRSAGRPEVIYVIERLVDKAAQEHGFDRVALRKRNLIPPSAFPYKNPQGIIYDSGTYRVVMDRAMELGDWAGFKKRRAEARKRKRLRGIGLCSYLETTGGYPRERADITVHPQGRVDVVVGTLSSGQSHETTFAQCVAEWLGVPFDDVFINESDTDIVKEGGGSHSARSMRLAGIVMGNASDMIIDKGQEDRRAHARDGRRRYRLRGWTLHRQRHRPVGRALRRRGGGRRWKGRTGRIARSARRDVRRDDQAAWLSRTAPMFAKSRSTRRPASSTSCATPAWTMLARPSIQWSWTVKPTAARHKASDRRCGNSAPMMPKDSSCRRHSWTMPCRAPIRCRHSPPISAKCGRRPTGLASAAPVKAAPPARSAPSSMPSSTHLPSLASRISKCR